MAVVCPDCGPHRRTENLLKKAAIPPRYLDQSFDTFQDWAEKPSHRKSQQGALTSAIRYVEEFPNVPRGILFVGPCGVGKTHLSTAILKALIEERQITGRFVDETELLRRLQYSYGPDSPDTEREVLIPLMQVDLLVWDDLGTGRPTDWVRETIRTVLNYRYTHGKQTILSTNWGIDQPQSKGSQHTEQQLSERIGIRLYSRLMEACQVIKIQAPDFRTGIRKAGMDQDRANHSPKEKGSPSIPPGLLDCPRCSSSKIEVLSDEARKSSVRLSCRCRKCQHGFTARFHPAEARVDYVASGLP